MAGIWAIGEANGGAPSRLTLELATLARTLAEAAGMDSTTVVLGDGAAAAAQEVARYAPRVLAVEVSGTGEGPAAGTAAPIVAALVEQHAPDHLLIAASPDGKDLAGALMALLGLPVLANASAVEWADGPQVEMSTFGGRLVTRSTFDGPRGILLVRPASVTAEPAPQAGSVETVEPQAASQLATVRVTERVEEAGATASIEEARIIVGGGRGVGSADGFRQVEALAEALGGAVGATRAVVDAGWIGYGQQIGQTG
ncbi:MAG: electron transfer flavoprotein subunit alpha/FixB family protein, partial [Chloroflexi bacterium]|nr:electron transfer flavoprotein subunit alpha/FixB family protein [Chloroflexota bacterium]